MSSFAWWQVGTVYQIYPRSFRDANGDGIGDLAGVREKLAYLQELGVDALWLSPMFPSPMKDFGYDISDYCGVDPIFGTLADFDDLVVQAHRLGLKLILDFVPNHTSDQHPWFAASRSARTDPKRAWYIWKDPAADGGPPSNWKSQFGGKAWTLDPATGQYYMHSFLAAQPDLNWRNPEVVAAMHDVLRFWLGRGVDGFRVDALHHVMKDDELRDNPPNPYWREGMPEQQSVREVYTTDRPEMREVFTGLRRVADEYEDRVLIGEMYLPLDRLMTYYGTNGDGLHLPFNFQLLQYPSPWRGDGMAALVENYERILPSNAWPNWVLGNHDKPRVATRMGPAQTSVAAMLLLTLRGAPTLYYGDELGMEDVAIAPADVHDPWGKNIPGLGRDPARTPMPWSAEPQAGFSSAPPWLPLGADWRERNVASEARDPASTLNLYKALLALRRKESALSSGSYRTLVATESVYAYAREAEGSRFVVALNFGSKDESLVLPAELASGTVVIDGRAARVGEAVAGKLRLAPHDALLVEIR